MGELMQQNRFMENQKILFIGTGFYYYDEFIIKKMNEFGADVDYICERPSFVKRLIFALQKRNKIIKKERYLIDKLKSGYDKILVIKGEYVSEFFISNLKELNPKAALIMYQWDEVDRVPSYNINYKYFDKIFTFSEDESKKRNEMEYLPNFYIDDLVEVNCKYKVIKYDLFTIGILYIDRAIIISKILNNIKNKNLQEYTNFIKLIFPINRNLIKNIANKRFFWDIRENVIFRKYSCEEYHRLLSESQVVIDIQYPNQKGLTQRCFDCIGFDKKLITTNKSVLNCDFYSADKILVIDRENPEISEAFLTSVMEPYTKELKNKYSLSNWILEIFSLNK